jgi:hypothetical protein
VDLAAFFGVLSHHRGSLPAEYAPICDNAALFEPADLVGWLHPFVEAYLYCVLVEGAAYEGSDARPGACAEAHGARLRTGDELVRGSPRPAEVEIPDNPLDDHERHHLDVKTEQSSDETG